LKKGKTNGSGNVEAGLSFGDFALGHVDGGGDATELEVPGDGETDFGTRHGYKGGGLFLTQAGDGLAIHGEDAIARLQRTGGTGFIHGLRMTGATSGHDALDEYAQIMAVFGLGRQDCETQAGIDFGHHNIEGFKALLSK
ncbi:hypothetical protein Ciccas_013011, partial [Cichlidogyrus casuarinus]